MKFTVKFLSSVLLLGGVALFTLTFTACGGSDDDDTPVTPIPEPEPEPEPELTDETFTVGGVQFKMVAVMGGTFLMGNTSGDDDEKPLHSVTLSSYYIGQTEVTQALWQAVMGSNPAYFVDASNPVERVS